MTPFQQLVADNGHEIALAEGEHAFAQGDSDEHVYWIKSGLLKAYYIRADGKEHLKSFQPEGSIIGSMVALIDGEPCSFGLVALEESVVVKLPYKRLEEAARGNLELANALVTFLSSYGKRKERREYELLTLSPEQRYQILLETMPDVVERVSQSDMAAYIGVTPQALSRIKRRISLDNRRAVGAHI